MAKRRMFSLDVVDTDIFLDMPASAQNLFFHLGTRADDDGFVGAPQRILRSVGASPDDLKILVAKGYVIPFESGICALRHWRMCNYLRNDRYTASQYTAERAQLFVTPSGTYEITAIGGGTPLGIPTVSEAVGNLDTQVRRGKDRSGKKRIDKKSNIIVLPPDGANNDTKARSSFVPPTVEEVAEYVAGRKIKIDPYHFHDHYTANGWMVGRSKMKDWRATVRVWERNERKSAKQQQNTPRSYTFEEGESL